MLGIGSGLQYKVATDFKNPEDYIEYLFDGINGWICRGQASPRYKQRMYRFNGLLNRQDWQGSNIYISMNTFYKNKRNVDALKRINALYVDIDCYKVGLSKTAVMGMLKEYYYDTVIPYPTFVIDSGRGLYLIWKLRNEDRNALPRWTRVQEYLIDKLKELGSDSACRDAARILRMPFTYNSKSNTHAAILEFNDLTYSILDIQKEYGIYKSKCSCAATKKMRRYAADLALKLNVEPPDFNDYTATKDWIAKAKMRPEVEMSASADVKMCFILQGYCKDIEALFKRRKGVDCKREIALFLYRLFTYYLTKDKDMALAKTLELNAALSCPFPERYVVRATRSAERKIDKGDTYHYKKSTIIDILDITSEEMEGLTYLIHDQQRKARKRANNKRAYTERLAAQGKQSKAEEKKKRIEDMIKMIKEGLSGKQIMEQLGISRATYYRDLALIDKKELLNKDREDTSKLTPEKEIERQENRDKTDKTCVVSNFQPLNYMCSATQSRCLDFWTGG